MKISFVLLKGKKITKWKILNVFNAAPVLTYEKKEVIKYSFSKGL